MRVCGCRVVRPLAGAQPPAPRPPALAALESAASAFAALRSGSARCFLSLRFRLCIFGKKKKARCLAPWWCGACVASISRAPWLFAGEGLFCL